MPGEFKCKSTNTSRIQLSFSPQTGLRFCTHVVPSLSIYDSPRASTMMYSTAGFNSYFYVTVLITHQNAGSKELSPARQRLRSWSAIRLEPSQGRNAQADSNCDADTGNGSRAEPMMDDRGCVKVGDMPIELVKLGGGAMFALGGKNAVGDCTVMKSRKKALGMRDVMTSRNRAWEFLHQHPANFETTLLFRDIAVLARPDLRLMLGVHP
ncbi:hypothetical protein B0H13DRAFT_1888318 [Mycena leptocephala]|nr:hypothetical protein B0H13DRAFT_1888318 [Mycena leptocephala]